MNLLSQDPALPLWAVAPPTILVMLFLAGHVNAMREADTNPRRRRIRTANGVLMMFTAALLAHALAIVSPSDSRTFLLTWIIIIALLGFIILLALIDALNSYSVYRQAMSRTRGSIKNQSAGHPTPHAFSPESPESKRSDG
jgi:quinol-cytochrome oxidoreductase complex cytochrome b subunit